MTLERDAQLKKATSTRIVVLTAGTVLVAIAGYAGFRLYPSISDGSGSGAGLMAVAAATGFAAFFSPCSFPLLLTVLTRQETLRPDRRKVQPALRFAAGASIGALGFVLGLGLLLSLGGGAIARQVTFESVAGRTLRIAVGLLLIVMGLVQLRRIRIPFSRFAAIAEPIQRRRLAYASQGRLSSSHVLYGFGYLIAGFG